MFDIETQIRFYAADLEELYPPVDHEDVLRRLEPVASRPHWVPNGLVVALAAAAAVILIGLVSALLVDQRIDPVVTQPSTPPRLPSHTNDWTRFRIEPEIVSSIVEGGPGLVGLGRKGIWMSPDGQQWIQATGVLAEDVTSGGPGLVAVGGSRVWVSEDGSQWDQIPQAPVFNNVRLQQVASGGPGLVALGITAEGPAAWYSTDGLTWNRAVVPSPPVELIVGVVDGIPHTTFVDIAVDGDELVAIGYIGIQREEGAIVDQLFIWTSSDGSHWSQNALDTEVFEGSLIAALTAGPNGFVAGGTIDQPAFWTSPDGITWRLAPLDQEAFISSHPNGFAWGGGPRSLTANSDGYVAVGGDGRCAGGACPGAEAAVWTSTDGLSWERVPTGPVFQDEPGGRGWVSMFDVTPWRDGFVAVGESYVWIGQASG